jgi:hypothetical protein
VAAALAGIGLIVWQMTVHHSHLYDISASAAALHAAARVLALRVLMRRAPQCGSSRAAS